ncbi:MULTISPECIES: CHASE2 domain-containing protein [Pacificimonas]|nr:MULTISPECIES: CHASE2 domain-containing protein [Pacificimonas]MBZ6380029.1 CHASE2 domain-containing protein [Pacificimonas aurantium]
MIRPTAAACRTRIGGGGVGRLRQALSHEITRWRRHLVLRGRHVKRRLRVWTGAAFGAARGAALSCAGLARSVGRRARRLVRVFVRVLVLIFEVIFDRKAAAIGFCLVFLVDLFDSFGIDQAGTRAFERMVVSVLGPLYAPDEREGEIDPLAADAPGRSQIAVVLINHETFEDNGQEGPPLSYQAQAELLDRISAAEPRAIFWDIYYPRSRLDVRRVSAFAALQQGEAGAPVASPGLQALTGSMKAAGQRAPLFIGPVSPDDRGLAPLRSVLTQPVFSCLEPDFVLCRNVPAARAKYRSGVHQVSLMVGTDEWNSYPLRLAPLHETGRAPHDEGEDEREVAGEIRRVAPSAAVAMYWARCELAEQGGGPPCTARPLPHSAMRLRWGLGSSRWMTENQDEESLRHCPESGNPVGQSLTQFGKGITRAAWTARTQGRGDRFVAFGCGYHDFVYADSLNDAGANGQPFHTRLKDRLVLVGFDLDGIDRWQAPYYGEVPGVLIHAMALDNLLTNDRVTRVVPRTLFLGIDQLDLFKYLIALLTFVILSLLRTHIATDLVGIQRGEEHSGDIIGAIWLACGTLIIILAYLGIYLRWPFESVLISALSPASLIVTFMLALSRGSSRK